MSKPGIKKNPDGTFTIVGAQERTLTQQQADYEELLKSAEMLPGESGFRARELLRTNPTVSGGLLSSLVENGAMPNNKLVNSLIEIDKMTQAERAKSQFLETQRIANERFNNTLQGRLWSGLKGFTRGALAVLDVPFELIGAGVRATKADLDAALRGDLNFFTRKPTDPTKTREDLGLTGGPEDVLAQTKLYQAVKQWRKEGRIDAGAGFTVDESAGIGFAARNAQMKVAKVRVKLDDGRTYDRPYSIFDPIVEFIPGIEPDTGIGSVVSAIGDLYVMLKSDPGLAYSRIKNARNALAQQQRTSEGMKAANIARDLALKDAELTELAKQTQDSIRAFETAVGAEKIEAGKKLDEALAKQLQLSDDMDKMSWNPEAVAAFLSGNESRAAIDALANMDNWEDVYAIGKTAGKRGGFSVEQSKSIAAAGTREEVLAAIAPYIADGKVVANVLETGTKVGNAIRGIADAAISAGSKTKIANSITGLAARGAAKLPYIDKVAKTVSFVQNGASKVKTNLSRSYNTVVPGGTMIHASDKDALVDAIYGYGRATGLSEDVISRLATEVAYSDNASEIGYTATGKLFDEIFKANLGKKGIDEEALREATRVFKNGNAQMGSYWAQRHAEGASLDFVISGDKKVTITGPHLDSEYLNSVVYLPPARELLDIISFVNRRGGKTLESVKEAIDVATNTAWKRMVLIRPAYVIRNIAEMQIRVMGTGHVSFFNNPIMALGMWLGRSESASAWRRMLDKLDPYRNTVMGTNFKLASAEEEFAAEILAHDAAESYIQSQSIRGVSSMDRDVSVAVKLAGFNRVDFKHPRWWEGLASEIRILSNSVAGRVAARTAVGKEQAGVDFVLRGPGKEEWDNFTRLQKPEIRDWLRTDEGAMKYLFTGENENGVLTSVRARVEEAAGKGGEASQAIKNLIGFGKIDADGFALSVPKGSAAAANSIKNAANVSKTGRTLKDVNQEFAEALRKSFDGKGDWNGLSMNVPEVRYGKYAREQRSMAAGIADSFFNIAVKFEKTSTMGPEWRQKYWDAIHDIAAALDGDAATKLADVAQQSLSPLKSWNGQPIGSQHKVWGAFKAAENAAVKASKEELSKVQKYKNKFPGLQEYKDGGSGGIVGTRSVVGFVKTSALKDMSGNIAGNKEAIEFYRKTLREGKGFSKEFDGKVYNEPIMVVYDNKTGMAYVGEGNHRLQAALAEGIEYVPVRVVKGYSDEMVTDVESGRFPKQIKNDKQPEFPETTGKNIGKVRDKNYIPPEMHPSYVFDKKYVLEESISEKKFGNVTLAQAHEYASTVASRHVRDLFYDASRKRLLFHQLRLIAPFGQAWEDTIKAWGKIALNNPMEVYKVQKVLNWLTSPESSALYQLTDAKDYYDPNQGFFYTDPLDGQRKFFLPFMSTGLNFLSNIALQVESGFKAPWLSSKGPYAVSATPQSLNFAFASGSIMPGVGPGISMGLAILDSYGPNPLKLLTPGLREFAYKIIYPFGEPNFKAGFLEALLPGNWRRILAPVMPDESYAASFAPTMNYLASSGNYNLDDRGDQERIITDTSTFAKWFTVMRGIFGAVSPFQLQFSGLTTMEDGNTLLTTALYNDFRKLEVAAGGDRNKAYNDFFDTYSPNLVFAIISSSSGGPTNLFTYEAIKDDPSIVTDYGDVYGYAYPGGGLSSEMYRWQQRMGNKVKFKPRELVERATLIRYYAAKDTLLARSVGEEWDSETFNEANESLREAFTGLGLTFKFDTYKDVRIADQLNRMAVDPRFEDSGAVRGLRDYLFLRQKAIEDSGRKTLENKASLPEREWLAEQAKEIIKRNPEFQNMFYAFFKKELEG